MRQTQVRCHRMVTWTKILYLYDLITMITAMMLERSLFKLWAVFARGMPGCVPGQWITVRAAQTVLFTYIAYIAYIAFCFQNLSRKLHIEERPTDRCPGTVEPAICFILARYPIEYDRLSQLSKPEPNFRKTNHFKRCKHSYSSNSPVAFNFGISIVVKWPFYDSQPYLRFMINNW